MKGVPMTRFDPEGVSFLRRGFVTLAWFWPGQSAASVWFFPARVS